jgi:hypothetical protein
MFANAEYREGHLADAISFRVGSWKSVSKKLFG